MLHSLNRVSGQNCDRNYECRLQSCNVFLIGYTHILSMTYDNDFEFEEVKFETSINAVLVDRV